MGKPDVNVHQCQKLEKGFSDIARAQFDYSGLKKKFISNEAEIYYLLFKDPDT